MTALSEICYKTIQAPLKKGSPRSHSRRMPCAPSLPYCQFPFLCDFVIQIPFFPQGWISFFFQESVHSFPLPFCWGLPLRRGTTGRATLCFYMFFHVTDGGFISIFIFSLFYIFHFFSSLRDSLSIVQSRVVVFCCCVYGTDGGRRILFHFEAPKKVVSTLYESFFRFSSCVMLYRTQSSPIPPSALGSIQHCRRVVYCSGNKPKTTKVSFFCGEDPGMGPW